MKLSPRNMEKFEGFLLEKKLYSPGPVPQHFSMDVNFSHRSKEFEDLYKNTKERLRNKFEIPSEYEILFIQGSGSCAIETVISSLCNRLRPNIYINGVFSERVNTIVKKNAIYDADWKWEGNYFYFVQFETSRSIYSELEKIRPKPSKYKDQRGASEYKLIVADCVSGFGFYPLPKADIIIASSSKIIGGLPVLGIILFNERAEYWFTNSGGDYLDILSCIKYDRINQTPHSSLIPQLLSLNEAIPNVINPEQIIDNCEALHSDKIQFEGEVVAPVLTIKLPNPKSWRDLFQGFNAEVYYNPSYMKDCIQVSMFNYRDTRYYELLRAILEENL